MTRLTLSLLLCGLCSTAVFAQTPSGRTASPAPAKLTFPNGFRLVVKPEPGKGLVALSLIVRAGALEEADSPALGQLLVRTLLTGARNLSPRKLAQLSSEVGGSFSATWDPDYTEIYVATTSDQLRGAVELLAETLIHPSFAPDIVDTAKHQLLAEIRTGRDGAFSSSYDELRRLLYTSNPYRQPLVAPERAVRSLDAEALQEFTHRWFVPGNMVLAIVGDVQIEEVQDAVKLWFGKQAAKAVPVRPDVPDEAGVSEPPSIMETDGGATYVIAGTLARGISSPGFAADMVVATALGGGKASRMFRDLRERRSLAYELGTLYPPLLHQSHVVAYVLAAPQENVPGLGITGSAVDEVREALLQTVMSLETTPLTEAEVERAKSFIIGAFAIRHERLQERAKHLAWFEAMGLGYQYDDEFPQTIKAVKLSDAKRSAETMFRRSALVVVLPKD